MRERLEDQKNYLLLNGLDSSYNASYSYGEAMEYIEVLSGSEMLILVM